VVNKLKIGVLATVATLGFVAAVSLFYTMRFAGSISKSTEVVVSSQKSLCAWAPWWDYTKAIEDARRLNTLDSISPFIYILDENGAIIEKINPELFPTGVSETKIFPSIYNDFDGDRVSRILNSREKSQAHILDILDLVITNNYDGIEIDYEFLLSADKEVYSSFIKNLAEALHEKEKLLVVTLHGKTNKKGDWDSASAQDWHEISKWADEVRVMVYDYHWETSGPGPISPLPWFENVVKFAKSQIPGEKLTIGVGLYGYDWIEGNTKATPLALQEIDGLINKSGSIVQLDNESYSPFLRYVDETGNHTVWFENEQSVSQKKEILDKYEISQVCIWRLGGINKTIEVF
jgi:spore germination protein YaaH